MPKYKIKKDKEHGFNPDETTPKEDGFQVTPQDRRRYNAYVKKRMLQTGGTATVPSLESWARINR